MKARPAIASASVPRTPPNFGPPPDGWRVSDEFTWVPPRNGGPKVITWPDEVKIRPQPGSPTRGATYRFIRFVDAPPQRGRRKRRQWIDVVGGTAGVTEFASFDPGRITRVRKLRFPSPAERASESLPGTLYPGEIRKRKVARKR